MRLLEALPTSSDRDHVDRLLLYTRAALTHLNPRVRATGVDALEWLVNVAGPQVVTAAGGWTKTLPSMLVLLGWGGQKVATGKDVTKGWSVGGGAETSRGVRSEDETKAQIRQMQVLALLLAAGLVDGGAEGRESREVAGMRCQWPLWQAGRHRVPSTSNPYAHLNLFGELGSEASELCPDLGDRMRVFEGYVLEMRKGIESLKKEGGGIGRAAVGVEKLINSIHIDTL
jgi:pre-rRNA-processing protein IPI1